MVGWWFLGALICRPAFFAVVFLQGGKRSFKFNSGITSGEDVGTNNCKLNDIIEQIILFR